MGLGIGITAGTRHYIATRSGGVSLSDLSAPEEGRNLAESGDLQAFSAQEELSLEKIPETGRAPGDAAKSQEAIPEALTEKEQMESSFSAPVTAQKEAAEGTEAGPAASAQLEETPVSPLSGSAVAGTVLTEQQLTRSGYQKKLEEIDGIVEEMRASDANSSTDSMKTVADYEYRLWDGELNHLYQAVIGAMGEEEADSLRSEEREWIRTRDLTARKAAARFKGGTMESLEYTASLAASTRERAYQILNDYQDYLPADPEESLSQEP